MRHILIIGDTIDALDKIKKESINCIITSPPYYQKRDYKIRGQIGLEESVEDYVKKISIVLKKLYKVLRKDGCFFLNIGDSIRKKNLLLVPERIVIKAQEIGFFVRNKIVWYKPNHFPSSAKDRFVFSYEFVYFFTKSKKYFFNLAPLKVPWKESAIKRVVRFISRNERYTPGKHKSMGTLQAPMKVLENVVKSAMKKSNEEIAREYGMKFTNLAYHFTDIDYVKSYIEGENAFLKNPSDLWCIPTGAHKEHLAVFPKELVKRCIITSTREKDIVLDPFVGSGTTMEVCEELNRNSIGIDIDPDSEKYVKERLAKFKYQKKLSPDYDFKLVVKKL